MEKIKVIAFDADDTLWVNEPYFREAEEKFCTLMHRFGSHKFLVEELFRTEMKNLPLYGYGAKAFTLSLIETALNLSKNSSLYPDKYPHPITPITPEEIEKIIEIGTSLLTIPIELLDGIEEVIKKLSGKYKIVVATKGDLLDQQKKLERSGLLPYFHHVEIMSDKKIDDYKKLLSNLDIKAEELVMVGNSLKSDVLPVLELGGYGVYIPFHTTWIHEHVDGEINYPKFYEIESAKELLRMY